MIRWLLRILGLLVLVILVAIAGLAWVNRDLPASTVDAIYGGPDVQRVNIDGVSLAYRVTGSGPPLVLLHSHFHSMRQWEPWVEVLSPHFTVIRYDLTTHGLTGPDPSDDYSRQRGAQLLLGLLQHLGLESTALAGSSTGGGLAWYFAAHYPERVEQLVLINAPGMPRITNPYMETPLPDWAGYVLYLLPESLFRPFLEAAVVDDSLITDAVLTEFFTLYRREGNRMAEFHRLRAWERGDISEDLAQITAPTLILWGEQNPQLPVAHVAQFRQGLSRAAQVQDKTYPGVGHVIPLEIPYQSAQDALTFLQGGNVQ